MSECRHMLELTIDEGEAERSISLPVRCYSSLGVEVTLPSEVLVPRRRYLYKVLSDEDPSVEGDISYEDIGFGIEQIGCAGNELPGILFALL